MVPDLMSMVGCSGEEFASILKALGFRRERRKLAPEPVAQAAAVEGEQQCEAAQPAAESFEDIWRPGKRHEARHAKRPRNQPRREQRAQSGMRERPRQPLQPKRERPAQPNEHSPFAALKELRRALAARQQERS